MKLFVDGAEYEFGQSDATIERSGDRLIVHTPRGSMSALAVRQGDRVLISFGGNQYSVERKSSRVRAHHAVGDGEMRAPMPGLIVDVRVTNGAQVSKGDVLVVLEAMKTQQPFLAPFEGIVTSLAVEVGQSVAEGDLLAVCSNRVN